MPAFRRFILLALPLAVGAALPLTLGEGAGADAASCSAQHPSSCRYTSDLAYEAGVLNDLDDLVDPARNDYRVPIIVRYPIGAEGPRPLVIWHHGGDPTGNCGGGTEEWGNLLAEAGYVVINPCRVLPDLTEDQRAECNESGFLGEEPVDDESCQYWLAQYRYGPITTGFILRKLQEIEAADPALEGMLDGERIAVAGFSAGTTSVHVNAGAWQQWQTDAPRYDEDTLREPVAFFAAGPQGPEYAGFGSGFQSRDGDAGWTEHSWTSIERPFMFVTGVGDETNEPPETRVAGFLTSSGNDNKYLLWNTEPDAGHGTMNLNRCESEVEANHCAWLGSAGLAYFDAVLRGRHAAEKWLESDAIDILTGSAIELYRR